jgi:plasmid stability protein
MEITLQNIPLPLEQALMIRASTEGKSVDRVALEVLQTSLGVVEEAKEPTIKRDLSFLWADGPLEPEVIQALEEQRQIDPELWK